MAESWFSLSREDQVEALEFAAARTGRPAHLLEKDIWVVWVLSAIYESDLASKLTFKGGTSLSKVYRIIDRFSEDVDLTYDIRKLAADLLKQGNPIPDSASQEKKISSAVRHRLPDWIEATVKPVIAAALAKDGLDASLTLAGKDRDKLTGGQNGNWLFSAHDPAGVWCPCHGRAAPCSAGGLRYCARN